MHLVQLKLNADGSIAQTHKSHSPKIAPLLLADYWKEIRGWKEKAFYKQLKVFIKNLGEDPENWVG